VKGMRGENLAKKPKNPKKNLKNWKEKTTKMAWQFDKNLRKGINFWGEEHKPLGGIFENDPKIRIKIRKNMKFGISIYAPLLAHKNVEKDWE